MIIYKISVLTFEKNNAIIRLFDMRVCWNRQTGTFEGRVSLTYGFKSRHSHQSKNPVDLVGRVFVLYYSFFSFKSSILSSFDRVF